MTSAPAQNIDSNQALQVDSAIFSLGSKIQEPSFDPSKASKDTTGSFSNLINNLSAKTEQMQTKFTDKAVKSNTSSINKFALQSSDKTSSDNVPKNSSLQLSSPSFSSGCANSSTAQTTSSQIKNSLNTDLTSKQDNSSSQIISDTSDKTVNLAQNATVEIKDTISKTEDLSNSNLDEEIKEDLEALAVVYLANLNTELSEQNSNELKDIFDKELNNIQNVDDVISALDNISDKLNNSTLSQDTKQNILDILNKIKSYFKNTLENLEGEIPQEAKQTLDGIMIKIAENLDKNNVNNASIKRPAIDVQEIQAIEKQAQLLPDDNSETISNAISQALDLIDELNSMISEDSDIELSQQDVTIIKEATQELQNIVNALEDDETIVFDKKTLEAVRVLGESEKITPEIKENIAKTLDLFDNQQLPDNQTLVDTKPNSTEEEFKITDTNTPSEIISLLEDFEKTQQYQELPEEDKKIIQDALDKVSKLANSKTSEDEPIQIPEDIKKEVNSVMDRAAHKKEIKDNIKTNLQTSETIKDAAPQINIPSKSQEIDLSKADNQIQIEDNTIYPAQNDEQGEFSQDKNEGQKQDDKINPMAQNISTDSETVTKPEISKNNQKIKPEPSNKSTKVETEDVADNQEVDTEIQEPKIAQIKEDILLDIKYSTDTSSALTVADEVTKLALEENNTLSNPTPVGNITYDAANSAKIIHNAQNIAQAPKEEFNPILNQIGDKLTQLKDSQKITMVLRPNDLGRLSIELISNKDGLTTSIIAQNEGVREYIEKHINNLRQQLAGAGINVNSIQIKTAGEAGSSSYEGNQNFLKQEMNQQEFSNKDNQRQEQSKQQQKEHTAQKLDFDMHLRKDFSSVLNKTLSYSI